MTFASANDADLAKDTHATIIRSVDVADQEAVVKAIQESGIYAGKKIYPFCFKVSTGMVDLGQTVGTDIRTAKTGACNWGQALFDAAQVSGTEVTTHSYKARMPGPDATPVPKQTFLRRVGAYACGAGYYPTAENMHEWTPIPICR